LPLDVIAKLDDHFSRCAPRRQPCPLRPYQFRAIDDL
jgi:hypothetical protein